MPKYTSNRQRNLRVGITSYTENLTVLEVTGGAYISSSVGIGTINPSQSLHVQGNARIAGAIYDSTNLPGNLGQVLQSTTTGTLWVNPAGVGVATYSDRAGIATNVIGGIASVTQLQVTGISTLGFITASNAYFTGIVTATAFVGSGASLTNLNAAPNIISDIDDNNFYYPLLSPVSSGTISTIVVSSNSIVFNPGLNYLGIGTTNPRAPLDVWTGDGFVRFGDVTDINQTTDNGLAFIPSQSGISQGGLTSYRSALFTEVNGRLLSYGVNVMQLESIRDTNFPGGIFRIDTRNSGGWADSNVFVVKRQPVGFATTQGAGGEVNGIVINLNTGNTYLAPNGGRVFVGTGNPLSTEGRTNIRLQVGAASTPQDAYISGRVGIGTTDLGTYNLHLQGDARVTGIVSASQFIGDTTSVISLSVSGISTLGTVQISSGIVTATSGVVTYYGDGFNLTNIQASAITGIVDYANVAGIATLATYANASGIATLATYANASGIASSADYANVAGIATLATNAIYADRAGIATYATVAGVSTNVIGGIASVTSLSVSGVSTFGTVQISSGIVTATSGVVTYYGDGSNLTGVGAQLTITPQDPVSSIIYPTLAGNIGVSSLGISTTKLSFIPSTNKLGIGTGTPRENLDVIGTIGIQSAGASNRFYMQYNISLNSLDFIFV
jgi:hypothetical protein